MWDGSWQRPVPAPVGLRKPLQQLLRCRLGRDGTWEKPPVLREQKYETFDFVLLAGAFLQDPDFSILQTMPKAWD